VKTKAKTKTMGLKTKTLFLSSKCSESKNWVSWVDMIYITNNMVKNMKLLAQVTLGLGV